MLKYFLPMKFVYLPMWLLLYVSLKYTRCHFTEFVLFCQSPFHTYHSIYFCIYYMQQFNDCVHIFVCFAFHIIYYLYSFFSLFSFLHFYVSSFSMVLFYDRTFTWSSPTVAAPYRIPLRHDHILTWSSPTVAAPYSGRPLSYPPTP